jgi:hypothetical protein
VLGAKIAHIDNGTLAIGKGGSSHVLIDAHILPGITLDAAVGQGAFARAGNATKEQQVKGVQYVQFAEVGRV